MSGAARGGDRLDWWPMDPRDLRSLLAGIGCTVCGRLVQGDDIRILAQREHLAFVELHCVACGNDTLGMVVPGDDAAEVVLDVARYGEFGPGDEARLVDAPLIGGADVAAMRTFLASYRGDLRSLVDEGGP